MIRLLPVLMLFAVCSAPLWAEGTIPAAVAAGTPYPAREAVGKAFPALDANMQSHLTAFLAGLAEGQVLVVGFGGSTASFTVGKESVTVDVRAGLPPLAGMAVATAQPPVAAAGTVAHPWDREGAKAGEEIIGPDGGKYVWVPEGVFKMGTTQAQYDYQVKHGGGSDWMKDEMPAHQVTISKGFWLGKCEVTNSQYRKFCQASGRAFPVISNQPEDHPVVNVSWGDARAYCRQYGLRLPTEAEWEYAARGPQGKWYPWGDEWNEGDMCCNSTNLGPGGATFPVGSFPEGASWCGALDMAGNVWEWCQDWYDAKYYAVSPPNDPMGPATGTMRVVRGESFRGVAWNSRAALRIKDPSDMLLRDRGFRAVIAAK